MEKRVGELNAKFVDENACRENGCNIYHPEKRECEIVGTACDVDEEIFEHKPHGRHFVDKIYGKCARCNVVDVNIVKRYLGEDEEKEYR